MVRQQGRASRSTRQESIVVERIVVAWAKGSPSGCSGGTPFCQPTQIVVRENERTNALQSGAVCPDPNARALICTSVPAGIVAASFA